MREEFLVPLSLTANALAMELRVPATRIGDIVKERRGVTADAALRLARCFGTTPEFWLNAPQAYDLSLAAAASGDRINRDAHPRAAAVPARTSSRRQRVQDSHNPSEARSFSELIFLVRFLFLLQRTGFSDIIHPYEIYSEPASST